MLSQSKKCGDDHNVRVRLRMRECRGVLTHAGGAVDLGTLRGKMEKLDPGRATGNLLGSDRRERWAPASEVHDERAMAARRNHESHMFSQSEKIGGEADDGPREEVHLKALRAKMR